MHDTQLPESDKSEWNSLEFFGRIREFQLKTQNQKNFCFGFFVWEYSASNKLYGRDKTQEKMFVIGYSLRHGLKSKTFFLGFFVFIHVETNMCMC